MASLGYMNRLDPNVKSRGTQGTNVIGFWRVAVETTAQVSRLDSLLWERTHGQLVPLQVLGFGVSWVELGRTESQKVLAEDEVVGRSQLLQESRAFEGEIGKA